MGRAVMAEADRGTPVAPGQVEVSATVSLRYEIREGG
jgi:uncharacterized protein YggE